MADDDRQVVRGGRPPEPGGEARPLDTIEQFRRTPDPHAAVGDPEVLEEAPTGAGIRNRVALQNFERGLYDGGRDSASRTEPGGGPGENRWVRRWDGVECVHEGERHRGDPSSEE